MTVGMGCWYRRVALHLCQQALETSVRGCLSQFRTQTSLQHSELKHDKYRLCTNPDMQKLQLEKLRSHLLQAIIKF